jgi:hypothetical protein
MSIESLRAGIRRVVGDVVLGAGAPAKAGDEWSSERDVTMTVETNEGRIVRLHGRGRVRQTAKLAFELEWTGEPQELLS